MSIALSLPRLLWPPVAGGGSARLVAEETPGAIVHDGSTHAAMMASPADLEDFAGSFSFTEGVIVDPPELRGLEVVAPSPAPHRSRLDRDGRGRSVQWRDLEEVARAGRREDRPAPFRRWRVEPRERGRT